MVPSRIPANAVIARGKLVDYLLEHRPRDDKSAFLGQAGFGRSQPELLERALREMVADLDAAVDGENDYGVFLRVEGRLVGPNGGGLPVVTIWLHRHADGEVHFVTLKPLRRKLGWA